MFSLQQIGSNARVAKSFRFKQNGTPPLYNSQYTYIYFCITLCIEFSRSWSLWFTFPMPVETVRATPIISTVPETTLKPVTLAGFSTERVARDDTSTLQLLLRAYVWPCSILSICMHLEAGETASDASGPAVIRTFNPSSDSYWPNYHWQVNGRYWTSSLVRPLWTAEVFTATVLSPCAKWWQPSQVARWTGGESRQCRLRTRTSLFVCAILQPHQHPIIYLKTVGVQFSRSRRRRRSSELVGPHASGQIQHLAAVVNACELVE